MLGSDWILTTYISSIQRRLVLDTRGLPVAGAQVMVEGVDKVTVTSDRGEYWRLLLPGQYKSVWINTLHIADDTVQIPERGRGYRRGNNEYDREI